MVWETRVMERDQPELWARIRPEESEEGRQHRAMGISPAAVTPSALLKVLVEVLFPCKTLVWLGVAGGFNSGPYRVACPWPRQSEEAFRDAV